MSDDVFAGDVVRCQWRRRWQGVHMGLEDDPDVQQVPGSRRAVPRLHLASARNFQAHNCWVGRSDQVVGLNISLMNVFEYSRKFSIGF